jgi:hypothetical protein
MGNRKNVVIQKTVIYHEKYFKTFPALTWLNKIDNVIQLCDDLISFCAKRGKLIGNLENVVKH